jgi:hypothetical protein
MGEALLNAVHVHIHSVYAQPEPVWHEGRLTREEAALLERECTVESEFDELRSRQIYYTKFKAGGLRPTIKTTKGGKVVALLDTPAQAADIPWSLWGRIFQAFAKPDGRPFTVFVCPHPSPRTFPQSHGEPVRPLHINGGYTYPCDQTCVFVYRAEDATRVLIHELLHAACTDRKGVGLEQMEAETEAWAELFWCALVTEGGNLKAFKSLVKQQSAWMRGQVEGLMRGRHMKRDGTATPFPWRYTLGKLMMWERWGILDRRGAPIQTRSLRLTVPPPAAVYRKFDVPIGSPFL